MTIVSAERLEKEPNMRRGIAGLIVTVVAIALVSAFGIWHVAQGVQIHLQPRDEDAKVKVGRAAKAQKIGRMILMPAPKTRLVGDRVTGAPEVAPTITVSGTEAWDTALHELPAGSSPDATVTFGLFTDPTMYTEVKETHRPLEIENRPAWVVTFNSACGITTGPYDEERPMTCDASWTSVVDAQTGNVVLNFQT
jgi:hypothetical protein